MTDRPIVYGARYYFPGRRISHSHIYSMRPDGTGRRQLTSGYADDSTPAWSPDGRWIAFTRVGQNDAGSSAICLVSPNGGSVHTIFPLGNVFSASAQWLSNSRLLVWYAREDNAPVRFAASVVAAATGKVELTVLRCWLNSLSPDKTYFTAWSDGRGEDVPMRVVRLSDGHEIALPREVGDTCAWLDNETLVVLNGFANRPTLSMCSRSGKVLQIVAIQRSPASQRWLLETVGGDKYSHPCFIDPIPGCKHSVLVGWQLGGSQQGNWAATYLVDMHSGVATPWTVTDTLVYSPDNRFFLTTRPRALVPIPDAGGEWGAPLLLGRVAQPTYQRPLVSGLVYVDGFDWHRPKTRA